MNKDAAEVIGRNIGIAGTIAGVSGAVGKAIAKSSLPPLQKAGIVVGSGIAGGAIHVGTSVLNRVVNTSSNTPPTSIIISSNNGVNKLIPGSEYSDLMLLILSIDTLTCVCLGFITILFMMILFKFYLNEDKVKMNLSSLIGDKMNNNLNYYLIKLIKLNKKTKTSSLYIFIIFVLLFIILIFDCYFITELYNNLDKFVDLHINNRK